MSLAINTRNTMPQEGTSSIVQGSAGITRADGLGNEVEVHGDQNAATLGAREEATVKARVALARMQPRDMDLVRTRLLKECRRPGFAEAAMYRLPRWNAKERKETFIEGLSVRFAEAAARTMGNLWLQSVVTQELPQSRTIEVWAMDLETNYCVSMQAVVSRTTERRADQNGNPPKNAGLVLSSRLNSYGDKVFVCLATDQEMYERTNNIGARLKRTVQLQMLPGDIQEEAKALIRATIAANVKEDPDKERKRVVDAFSTLGIDPTELKSFVQARFDTALERLRPEHLQDLRGIHNAVRDGAQSWESFMEAVAGQREVSKTTGEVVTAPSLPMSTKPPEGFVDGRRTEVVDQGAGVYSMQMSGEEDARVMAEQARAEAAIAASERRQQVDGVPAPKPSPAASVGVDPDAVLAAIQATLSLSVEERAAALKKLGKQVEQVPAPRKDEVTKAFINARMGRKAP